jgi:hypothetical protein
MAKYIDPGLKAALTSYHQKESTGKGSGIKHGASNNLESWEGQADTGQPAFGNSQRTKKEKQYGYEKADGSP